MVDGAQVLGVGRCRRIREQVCRAAGGLGRAVHAQRPGPDVARHAAGSQAKTVEGHRGTTIRRQNDARNGQRIQTGI